MAVKTWCGHLVQLIDCLVCQFAVPFNAFLRMSLRGGNIRTIFSDSSNFSDAPVEIRDSNIFTVFLKTNLRQVYIRVQCIPSTRNQETMWTRQINVFHPFLQHGIDILLLSSQFDVIHVHRQEQTLLAMHQQAFPVWYVRPSKSQ